MARQEHDREDLLAEAKALVVRAELRLSGEVETIVFGFRRDGCASVYFGPDAACHFNTASELRRAYLDGLLYKADRGQLVSLERARTLNEVQLRSRVLPADEALVVLNALCQQVASLERSIISGDFELVGQVPPDGDVVARFIAWLAGLPRPPRVASSPHAR